MASYVNDLRLKEIGTGESSGTWGTETNTNLELIGEALGFGTEAITTNADTHTTTVADGSTDPGRAIYLKYTGTLDSACTITIGPNTMSRMHFIENGTSGSQNIVISQGTGANVTIPAGDVKAVYLDGAGSGAAVADAFASLNVVDLKVEDDLTVTDDATIGGTLGVTGIVTLTDDLIIGDGKTIGSASDVDAMTIASNGQVTFSQTLIGTALDISGDIDVDGTTNLDVVDIDGAVDMASTLAVGGVLTANAGVAIDNITIDGTEIDLSSGDLTIDVAGDIILDADGGNVTFKDGGTAIGDLGNSSSDFVIEAKVQDKDIIFKGDDGGSGITALTLDMSDAGAAAFNNKASFGGGVAIGQTSFTGGNTLMDIHGSGSGVGSNIAFANDHNTDKFFVGIAGDTTGDALVFNAENSDMIFGTNNSERMRLMNDGSLGINTTSPSSTLEVNGTINGVGISSNITNFSESILISNDAGTGTLSSASNNTGLGFEVFDDITSAVGNTAVGRKALTALTTGSNNTAVGLNAMLVNTTGSNNVAIGRLALDANSTGSFNTALGTAALGAATTADENTAVGYVAGSAITTGTFNTLIGSEAGDAITTGSQNTALGKSALGALTTGDANVAIGYRSMLTAGTGVSDNVAIGRDTLYNTTGSNNVAVGRDVLINATTADNNTAMGYHAADAITTGDLNVAIGNDALGANTVGDRNVAIGSSALATYNPSTNEDGYNVAVGLNALFAATTGNQNVVVGGLAGEAVTTGASNSLLGHKSGNDITTGDFNTFIGRQTGEKTTTSDGNTAVGYIALQENTTGALNVAVGQEALQKNTTASSNVAIGYQALEENISGEANVAIGYGALDGPTTRDNNTAVGYQAASAAAVSGITAVGRGALNANTSGWNTAVGYLAGNAITTGSSSVFLGAEAGLVVTTGSSNTIVGHQAGKAVSTGGENSILGRGAGIALTTGGRNTLLGDEAGSSLQDGSDNVAIGHDVNVAASLGNSITLGSGISATGSNDFSFGKASNIVTNNFDADADWSRSSDIRKKRNINDDNLGLSFINNLRPVTFQWKPSNEFPKEWNEYSEENNMNLEAVMHGMIAQEVKEALDKESVDTFAGWSVDNDGMQRLSREMFITPLINAVKELSEQIEQLKKDSHSPKNLPDLDGYNELIARIENLEKEK